jgi:hypothetical protein
LPIGKAVAKGIAKSIYKIQMGKCNMRVMLQHATANLSEPDQLHKMGGLMKAVERGQ